MKKTYEIPELKFIGQADEVVMGSFPGGIDNGLDSAPDFDFEQD